MANTGINLSSFNPPYLPQVKPRAMFQLFLGNIF